MAVSEASRSIRFSGDIESALKKKLRDLQTIHEAEVDNFRKRVVAMADQTKAEAERQELLSRAHRLTLSNMLRLALDLGTEQVKEGSPKKIFKQLSEVGVVRGRPRGT